MSPNFWRIGNAPSVLADSLPADGRRGQGRHPQEGHARNNSRSSIPYYRATIISGLIVQFIRPCLQAIKSILFAGDGGIFPISRFLIGPRTRGASLRFRIFTTECRLRHHASTNPNSIIFGVVLPGPWIVWRIRVLLHRLCDSQD